MIKETFFTTLFLATITLAGCASDVYKPSPNVTELLSTMDETQAAGVIQTLIQPRNYTGSPTRSFVHGYIGMGLCNANGFSLDGQKGLNLQVTKEDISFNAIKNGKLLSSTSAGQLSSASDVTTVDHYEDVSYREHLRFDKIAAAIVYEPRLFSSICDRQVGQTEVVISESASRWYAALIPTSNKDQFIAALLRLKPDINITTKSKDDIGNF